MSFCEGLRTWRSDPRIRKRADRPRELSALSLESCASRWRLPEEWAWCLPGVAYPFTSAPVRTGSRLSPVVTGVRRTPVRLPRVVVRATTEAGTRLYRRHRGGWYRLKAIWLKHRGRGREITAPHQHEALQAGGLVMVKTVTRARARSRET